MQLEAHPSAFPNAEFEQLMARYQQADPGAVAVLVERLSPQLYRFFASQLGNRADAEDMLQDAWLRIHRVRHTYRAGDPVLPWVYTIARRVRVDNHRKRIRISSRETGVDVLPEFPARNDERSSLPSFEELVAVLPESQREVVTMLKVDGLSLEEIARVTSSTTGAVKQKAHRAYCERSWNGQRKSQSGRRLRSRPPKELHNEESDNDLPGNGCCHRVTCWRFNPSTRRR